MVTLQQNFSSMEKKVQKLKDTLDGPSLDPLDLMKVYKDKLLEGMWKQQESAEVPAAPAAEEEPASPEASRSLEESSGESNPLLERLRALEAENSALSLENHNQRKQYERCLDEVANQVVQALLTQKDLKEECVKLRTRVFDLEQQNRILNVLFQQRVKMSTAAVSAEVQMNGKADAASERCPSLQSLTCQGSSGSGSDLSLSRACSEYSSGSYTWAEGHGCSKQCSKRMSGCSVHNNHSVPSEEAELGWKEGHILKGLKCLQTSSSKEQSLKTSSALSHDCMTSNEGIYSLGSNVGPQGSVAKQRTPIKKPSEGFTALDSDDMRDDKMEEQSREDTDESKENMEVDDGSSTEEPVDLGVFTSPVKDNYQPLEGPSEKPGVSPTATSPYCDKGQRNKSLSLKQIDRNNNQEGSADHKTRADYVPTDQDRFTTNKVEDPSKEVQSPLTHSGEKVLSSPVKEARLCSSLIEVTQWREQVSRPDRGQDYAKSSQRKLKPQPCDSARKAFILRSKSADGGPSPAKHTHSPLHQKLMKNPWSKGQTSQTGQGIPSKRKNPGNTNMCTTEKEEDTMAPTSMSLENVNYCSPLASPSKYSKTFNKSSGVTGASESPIKLSQKSTRFLTSNQPVNESGHEDVARQEYSSPPAPPGRTTSLLHRASHGSSPEADKSKVSSQICAATKKTSCSLKPEFRETQGSPKPQPLVSRQLSLDISTTYHDAPQVMLNHSVLQRSQQSVSEPRLSEVLPHVHGNVFCHGVSRNVNSSTSRAVKTTYPINVLSNDSPETGTFLVHGKPQMKRDGAALDKALVKIETRCDSFDCEPQPAKSDGGMMLDWGFDEEGWLFKRSVSVSTRPLLKPVMGMNGMKARSQSFGARYMDRPKFNRPGNVRTQIKTQSGSSLNSLADLLPGSMSCSSSYHCPMNQSLLNNFMIEEGLTGPTYLGSSRERLQSIKLQQEQARRIQIEQQFSKAFGSPVSEEPEIQSTITRIEEKVMLGIEENLHKSQEQEKSIDVKQKSTSSLANWFGLRKSRLPGPSGKKTQSKGKEDKKEQQIPSLRGGKQGKSDKKKDRRKSDGKDCSVGRRESHDAVRSCISMPCPGVTLTEIQGQADITRDSKMRSDGEPASNVDLSPQDPVTGSSNRMRTLDSGIGTIPLPESCSFFSNILHLLPKPSFTSDQSLKPRCVPPITPSEDVSSSQLPRWRVPAGGKGRSPAGVPNSQSESSMTPTPLPVPVPTVVLLQPTPPQSEPILTSVSVCPTKSGFSKSRPGGAESKLTHVKPKTKATVSRQKESTRVQPAQFGRVGPEEHPSAPCWTFSFALLDHTTFTLWDLLPDSDVHVIQCQGTMTN